MEQVCNELKEQVAANTIIVPVMNGVDNAEKNYARAFPKKYRFGFPHIYFGLCQ